MDDDAATASLPSAPPETTTVTEVPTAWAYTTSG
jgi:hypothetical protein